jgi:hypothetical protein
VIGPAPRSEAPHPTACVADDPERVPFSAHTLVQALLFVVVLLALRALLAGATWPLAAWSAAFVAGWIFLPGHAIARSLRIAGLDLIGELAFAGAFGVGALTACFLLARTLHSFEMLWLVPLIGIGVLAKQRSNPIAFVGLDRNAKIGAVGLCVVTLLCCHYTVAAHWSGWIDDDVLFHVGNTAEVLKPLPMHDPRVAGELLNYHTFGYSPAAVMARLASLPVFDACMGGLQGLLPLILVGLVHAATRALCGSSTAGLVASFLFVLHADPGQGLRAAGLFTPKIVAPISFNAFTPDQIFASPSTCSGLIWLLVSFLLAQDFLSTGRKRVLIAVAFSAFIASGSKGSLVPTLIGALALFVIFTLFTRRPFRRGFVLLLVIGCAAAPETLILATGASSYARAMFRFDPASVVTTTGFARVWNADPARGCARWWLILPWLGGYLGPIAWLGAVWLWRVRKDAVDRVLLSPCFVAAGIGLALAYSAPARSQLFFLQYGEVILLVCACCALIGTSAVGARMKWVMLVLALPFIAGGIVRSAVLMQSAFVTREPTHLDDEWKRAADWVRANTAQDSLVVSRSGEMLVSVHAERRSLLEDPRFTPQNHAVPAGTDPWTDWKAIRERCFTAPDRDLIGELRRIAPDAREIYVLCDDVKREPGHFEAGPAPDLPALQSSALWQPVFTDDAARVYRCIVLQQ